MAMIKAWQKKILCWISALTLLIALVALFVFSPFYARSVLWALNKVPVSVNQIAAASQKGDGLIVAEDQPEPGSTEWLNEQKLNEQLLNKQHLQAASQNAAAQQANNTQDATNKHNATIQQDKSVSLVETITQISQDEVQESSKPTVNKQLRARAKRGTKSAINNAHAIVVLGGGLSRDAERHIIVNSYTRLRLEKAIAQKKYNPLPILLSGVEAPFMQRWLSEHDVNAKLLEDRSMNTCENTRFSALLLQKKGGAPLVELVTDAYHMPRARRLFAMNGVDTIPIVSPLPDPPTSWIPSTSNLMHSRRATYEAAATLRDLWVGETNCREIP